MNYYSARTDNSFKSPKLRQNISLYIMQEQVFMLFSKWKFRLFSKQSSKTKAKFSFVFII